MTTGKQSTPLAVAESLAGALVRAMKPCVHQVVIAGSIRRRKPFVGDLELVCIPRWEDRIVGGLFEEPVNTLYADWATNPACAVTWTKGFKPEGKFWQGHLPDGRQVDLFLANPRNFGLILAIRTGSADFSQALVTSAHRLGMRSEGGYLRDEDGNALETPTEEDVFRLLRLRYVPPDGRTGPDALFPY